MTITSSPKTLIAIAVTVFGTAIYDKPAEAASFHHIDQLAVSLQGQARQLLSEFRQHHQHTGEYQHLTSDAYQMYRLAAHIHSVAHRHGSLYHIRHDLQKLDKLFHHLEGLVGHIEYHPHGHIHGHTGHVHQLLASMESTLHHLQDDVREMTDPHHGHGHGPAPIVIDPGHGHHGHAHSGVGIRFGNGRISFRIGF